MLVQVVFLGTSGSVPTPKRNVMAIAVKMGAQIILLDCGEGTQRQFMNSNLSFMQVSKILLSHLHGDHFLGLNGLIQTMSFNSRKEKLEIYGPTGTSEAIAKFLGIGYFQPSFTITVTEMSDGEKVDFGAYSINAAVSDHTVPSLAYAIEETPRRGKFDRLAAERLGIPPGPLYTQLQEGKSLEYNGRKYTPDMVLGPPRRGRKLVYSGDTKPCSSVAGLAQGCDLLIHDCTIDSALEEKTNPYGHSSARQAAEIAVKAGVRALALVHISPRYEDSGIIEKEARAIFENTFVPDDLALYEVEYPD